MRPENRLLNTLLSNIVETQAGKKVKIGLNKGVSCFYLHNRNAQKRRNEKRGIRYGQTDSKVCRTTYLIAHRNVTETDFIDVVSMPFFTFLSFSHIGG
ncbi:MAG: hypothetical protein HQK99_14570 [Nitrospirae bacterium]|nr:hypothetical protein [Nitrospirota bacterium]